MMMSNCPKCQIVPSVKLSLVPNCPELKVLPDATQTNWSIDQSMPFTFKNLSAPLAWQVLDFPDQFWTWLTSFGFVWQVLDLLDNFEFAWQALDLLDKFWTCLSSFGLAWQVLDLLDKCWTCLTCSKRGTMIRLVSKAKCKELGHYGMQFHCPTLHKHNIMSSCQLCKLLNWLLLFREGPAQYFLISILVTNCLNVSQSRISYITYHLEQAWLLTFFMFIQKLWPQE